MGRTVTVVGLGYVGLPLAISLDKRGMNVTGYDLNSSKVKMLLSGESYIEDVTNEEVASSNITFSSTPSSSLGGTDTVLVCVPTPLKNGKPNYEYVESAFFDIADHLARWKASIDCHPVLLVLESTVGPGTTSGRILKILEDVGLELDRHFHLAFSPERVDPKNSKYDISNTPKVVGGVSEASGKAAEAFYLEYLNKVHLAPNSTVAELSKLWENSFRLINIAFAQEMDLFCRDIFEVDTREVLAAASTKPFGFMPFHPGAGIGGHCISVDPVFLQHELKKDDYESKLIKSSLEVNQTRIEEDMYYWIINEALRYPAEESLFKLLFIGVSYKAGVSDIRESGPLKLYQSIKGAFLFQNSRYHDPLVPVLPDGDESVSLDNIEEFDAVVPLVLQEGVDFDEVRRRAKKILNPALLPGFKEF